RRRGGAAVAVRQGATADGIQRGGVQRGLQRRAYTAWCNHQDWECSSETGVGGGGMVSALCAELDPEASGTAGGTACCRCGDRREGTSPTERALSAAVGAREAPTAGCDGNCPGVAGFRVGHRRRSRAHGGSVSSGKSREI